MNKEQLIKEICKLICATCAQFDGCAINCKAHRDTAEVLYKAGYRKVPDGAVILTPEERDEELKACNEKQAELENEIYGLKTNYDCLCEHCTDLENKNVAAQNMIDSQAKEIERLKADNEALKMWNEAYTEENEKLKNKNIKLLQVIKDFAKKHCNMKCKIAKRRVEDFAEYLRYAGRINQGFDIIKQVGVREYCYSDEELAENLKEFLK